MKSLKITIGGVYFRYLIITTDLLLAAKRIVSVRPRADESLRAAPKPV